MSSLLRSPTTKAVSQAAAAANPSSGAVFRILTVCRSPSAAQSKLVLRATGALSDTQQIARLYLAHRLAHRHRHVS